MNETMRMYEDLLKVLLRHLPCQVYGDVRRVRNLAWAVIGLCLTRTVSVSGWAEAILSRARQAASRQRRLARWLDSPLVQAPRWYAPLVRAALADWEVEQRYDVALDTSVLGPFVLIRTALIYRGRAIPLAWRVLRHGSASVAFADYRTVLEQTAQLLPAGARVVGLADRGFGHRELIEWARRHGWHVRLRLKSDTLVHLPSGECVPVGRLGPPQGEAHFYHDVALFNPAVQGLHLALGRPDDSPNDPWYLLSDEPTDVGTFDEFGLRFDIEESFLDDKSGGFQVQASELGPPAELERLFLVLAVATLYFTSVGIGVACARCRRWVDTHWDRGLSYLKIGWNWVRQQYRRGWPSLSRLWLDPAPDPEPALASRRQAARPRRTWTACLLC